MENTKNSSAGLKSVQSGHGKVGTSDGRKKGRRPGVSNSDAAAAHSDEYRAVVHKAQQMGVSVRTLCDRAGVNFNTFCTWRNRFPRTINAAEMYRKLMEVI